MIARTFADVRELTLPHLPYSLATPESRAHWSGRRWPLGATIGPFAWECRLGRSGGPVDVQTQLSRAACRDLDPPPGPMFDPSLFAVLRDWAQGGGGPIQAMFVEMDENGPSLLFPRIELVDRAEWVLFAGLLLHRLSGGQAPANTHRALGRAALALPESAEPLYVAWMGARGAPVARLIASVPRNELARWLSTLGWPGDGGAAAATIAEINPGSSHVPVGLDLGEGAAPILGAEVHWSGPPMPGDRTHQALDKLARWPELDPERVEGARRWLTESPAALRARLQLKLGFWPGGRTAKAYLGAWTDDGVT